VKVICNIIYNHPRVIKNHASYFIPIVSNYTPTYIPQFLSQNYPHTKDSTHYKSNSAPKPKTPAKKPASEALTLPPIAPDADVLCTALVVELEPELVEEVELEPVVVVPLLLPEAMDPAVPSEEVAPPGRLTVACAAMDLKFARERVAFAATLGGC
jgi:hypothetical protein